MSTKTNPVIWQGPLDTESINFREQPLGSIFLGMSVLPCPKCGERGALADRHEGRDHLFIHQGTLVEGRVITQDGCAYPTSTATRQEIESLKEKYVPRFAKRETEGE